MDTVKITVPGKPVYRTMLRLVTSSLGTLVGFDVEQIEDMKTSISEACKIVSCHGKGGYSSECELEYTVDGCEIIIKVTDKCDEHSIEKIDKPCRHCPQDGNMSVVVIESLMDSCKVGTDEDGRKYVKMVKKHDYSRNVSGV